MEFLKPRERILKMSISRLPLEPSQEREIKSHIVPFFPAPDQLVTDPFSPREKSFFLAGLVLYPKAWLSAHLRYSSCSFFWLYLGVTLDLVRITSFAYTLKMPFRSMGLFNTARNSWLCQGWNLTRYLKGLNNLMMRNLAKLEAIIQSLIGTFLGLLPYAYPAGKKNTLT